MTDGCERGPLASWVLGSPGCVRVSGRHRRESGGALCPPSSGPAQGMSQEGAPSSTGPLPTALSEALRAPGWVCGLAGALSPCHQPHGGHVPLASAGHLDGLTAAAGVAGKATPARRPPIVPQPLFWVILHSHSIPVIPQNVPRPQRPAQLEPRPAHTAGGRTAFLGGWPRAWSARQPPGGVRRVPGPLFCPYPDASTGGHSPWGRGHTPPAS